MHSKAFSILRTLIISLLISCIFICIMALLMWKVGLSSGGVKTGICICHAVSCLFGGFCMGRIFPRRRILWGAAFGILYFLLLLVFAAIFCRSAFCISSGMVTSLICCCAGAAAGAFIS